MAATASEELFASLFPIFIDSHWFYLFGVKAILFQLSRQHSFSCATDERKLLHHLPLLPLLRILLPLSIARSATISRLLFEAGFRFSSAQCRVEQTSSVQFTETRKSTREERNLTSNELQRLARSLETSSLCLKMAKTNTKQSAWFHPTWNANHCDNENENEKRERKR